MRRKYGNNSVQRARILKDKKLAQTDIKGEKGTLRSDLFDEN